MLRTMCIYTLCISGMVFWQAGSAHAQLEGQWNFEEGVGTTTADTSGNGRDGTLVGGATWVPSTAPVPGGSDFAIDFNGVNGSVTTTYQGIGGSASRTVSTWLNTSDVSNDAAIVGWGTASTNGQKWHFRINDNVPTTTEPRVQGALRTETQGGNQTGSRFVADGNWHHVVSVFAGDNNDDVVHWVDGRRDLSSFAASQTVNTSTTSAPVTWGSRDQSGTISYLDGQLDQASLHSVALSPRDIRILATGSDLPVATINYNAATAPTGIDTQNVYDNNPGIDANDFDLQSTGTQMTNTPTPGQLNVTSYWNYDGSQSSLMFDATGNIDDGFRDVPGDGTNDSASFLMTVRRDNQIDNQVLFEAGGNGSGTSLNLLGDTLNFTVKHDAIDTSSVDFDLGNLGTDDFMQILGVINLDDATSHIDLYVDGVLVGTDNYAGTQWAGVDDGGLAGVFSDHGGNLTGFVNFDGDIADFSYFTEALDATDAANLFAASQLAAVPEPSSIALWTLLAFFGMGMTCRRRRRLAKP